MLLCVWFCIVPLERFILNRLYRQLLTLATPSHVVQVKLVAKDDEDDVARMGNAGCDIRK